MAVLNGERMHDTMERLLPGARSAALLWQGAAVLGGAALGAGQVYGGAAPFGLALVIGCPPSYCLAAALGTLAAGLAFQPMLLGVKLAVAAVAAAAVRRLIDGRSGAGALAGCLTLTAAQVLQIVLAGDFSTRGRPSRWGVRCCWPRFLAGRSRIFLRGSRAASACGWLWLRHVCSAVPSGPWLRAWRWPRGPGCARPSAARWSRPPC
ncbi:MAG: hypothetical protein ACLSCW_00515 [Gemmiger formicilis]